MTSYSAYLTGVAGERALLGKSCVELMSRTNDHLSQESQRDDPKRSLGPSKITEGQVSGHRIELQPVVNTWSFHQFVKLKGRFTTSYRAHAQSSGNPVRLLWLNQSHDAIRTRIHDEMSQPLYPYMSDTTRTTNKVLR
jgi:hypothetical protein